MIMTQYQVKPVHSEFQERIDAQPYDVELDGLRLRVERGVFPPDLGRAARNLARLAVDFRPRAALDMGCGSGYVALYMKAHGVETVWASDIHGPAVECARANVDRNPQVGFVGVIQGDLFSGLDPALRFDLIAFNQPFGPGPVETVCGCGPDGGRQIIERFLTEAPARLNERGVALLCFSSRENAVHDPGSVAQERGWNVRVALHLHYGGADNFIYELSPP